MTTTASHPSTGGAAGSGHRCRREERGVRAPVDRAAHRQPHRPDESDRDPLRHHPRPSLPPLRRTQPRDPHGPSPRRLAPVRRARHPGHHPDPVGSTAPGAVHPPPPGRTRPPEGADGDDHARAHLRHPGRQDVPAVPFRHPDHALLRQGRARRRTAWTRAATTTAAPPATRSTSASCSTGSGRTCAARSGGTCSTSPPSNPNAAAPRTCTPPSAAPCPARSSGRSSPPPTTRCGGRPRPAASTPRTARRSGTNPRPACYVDPDTGAPAPTWEQALDEIDDDPTPPRRTSSASARRSTSRASSPAPTADKALRYLAKYLTKAVGEMPRTRHRRRRRARRPPRRGAALGALLASPARTGCSTASHPRTRSRAWSRPLPRQGPRARHLGYGGRRCLVSRKWSGKNLNDHRDDRRAHVLKRPRRLGATAEHDTDDPDLTRYAWQLIGPNDPDQPDRLELLLRSIHQRRRWREQYDQAKTDVSSATHDQGWPVPPPREAA